MLLAVLFGEAARQGWGWQASRSSSRIRDRGSSGPQRTPQPARSAWTRRRLRPSIGTSMSEPTNRLIATSPTGRSWSKWAFLLRSIHRGRHLSGHCRHLRRFPGAWLIL
jgi:hypothetical protein